MYICGVTPYDVCHLGHARAYVTFDVIKRDVNQGGLYDLFGVSIVDTNQQKYN